MRRFVVTSLAAIVLGTTAIPAVANAGDTLYQNCIPSYQGCPEQLEDIDQYAPHISRVMNYYLWSGGTAAAQDYIRQADANGQKVIVMIDDAWSRTQLGNHVDAVKNLAGTWGYYLGDVGHATPYPETIANHDNVSKHPRVYIDKHSKVGQARTKALAASGDVEKIGYECFPIWTMSAQGAIAKSNPPFDYMDECGDMAADAHDIGVRSRSVNGAFMVVQAFAFDDECAAEPDCAGPPPKRSGPYPTYSQQCKERDVVTPNAVQILWFGAFFMTNNNWHGRLDKISRAAVDPNCD